MIIFYHLHISYRFGSVYRFGCQSDKTCLMPEVCFSFALDLLKTQKIYIYFLYLDMFTRYKSKFRTIGSSEVMSRRLPDVVYSTV